MRLMTLIAVVVSLAFAACGDATGTTSSSYPAAICASAKQYAAGVYCRRELEAWARWETAQDATARDDSIQQAFGDLRTAWSAAEAEAADNGANCVEDALTSADARTIVDEGAVALVESINDGLELGQAGDAKCGAELLNAAAEGCGDLLAAESKHIADLEGDRDGTRLAADKTDARATFSRRWKRETCSTNATEEATRANIESLTDRVVLNTIVSPALDGSAFTMISPTGTTSYLGKELEPTCLDGSPFHFFGKRGATNKLLIYYQGGGACWESLTCSIPVCDSTVEPDTERDNPNLRESGFLDLDNESNPFRDWHTVFVNHCGCDIHYGDTAQDYDGVQVEHRGFHNARYAERWAREHFLNPEVVFVAGSSAGAYGAVFHAALLHGVWPASQFHVLADAGNGVITRDFLQDELTNWNFDPNLPDVPGVAEAITSGEGIPAYMEAVATRFPETNWAHYTAAYDGSSGGQSGFYNVMLNDDDPIATLAWWEASCAFNEQMRIQARETFNTVPSNYRYYIGTGSQHTMWGNDKVFFDTTGGVPTLVDWINAMLDSGPTARDPAWVNVECTNCGLTLPDDPLPEPVQDPFVQQGDDIVIVCE